MTGLGLAVAGWAAFVLAALVALRSIRAAAVRGQAVARACHEVRGPLAAVRLGLEAGLGASIGRLRAIQVELARATAALDDLQAVERIESPDSETELIEVRTWLTDSVEAWRPVALAQGTEVLLDWRGSDARVRGRRSRLAQVTGNLVANAIDHGRAPVVVRGWVEGSAVKVEVADAGPGLPGPAADRLAHTDGRGRGGREWGRDRPNGRGHGLRIARAVAEAHGGRLAVGQAERGARLVLTLPLA